MPFEVMKQHPARTVDFATLYRNLQQEVRNGTIIEVQQGDLSLFCYTNRCVYHRLWNSWNILARGLILDRSNRQVIATPFPKFFNYGELSQTIPDEPFEVYEKLDGSLGIAYYYQDNWHIATKGSFDSSQANWGTEQLRLLDLAHLKPGTTYLFELVYPDNQIVVKYSFEGLILLAAYDADGYELIYAYLTELAEKLWINLAFQLDTDAIKTILEQASNLDRNSEGFVIRFANGLRLKIKGSEYCRIHKLISGVTPLGIWESLKNGDDLESFRQEIPEEYWTDFDSIYDLLLVQFNQLVAVVETYHQQHLTLSDKELGLILNSLPDPARKFIFSRRKGGDSWFNGQKVQDKLYESIRPTSNYLDGYSASETMRSLEPE